MRGTPPPANAEARKLQTMHSLAEEADALRAYNTRLLAEVDELREHNQAMRERLIAASLEAPPPPPRSLPSEPSPSIVRRNSPAPNGQLPAQPEG